MLRLRRRSLDAAPIQRRREGRSTHLNRRPVLGSGRAMVSGRKWVLAAAELPVGIRPGRGDLSVSIGAFFGSRRIQIVYMSRYDQ